ncbi:hypothetical protein PT281_07045 [Lactobacillus sp. ESL0701]|uniref:hypothetical protein n=1 Tax=Lactobacillus sp. ESL0701 TaxID=2983217 RepID=UPI0023F7FB07|nr:hypothetical protein [Lactobacillus sp. ESL0701]MDF7673021.1 hypothetical protein [Lactobacillus sp. ESL0701]
MVIGICFILLSLVIMLLLFVLQRKKYFYIGNFVNDTDGLVIKLSETGRYIINKTIFGNKVSKQAVFQIEEGKYLVKNHAIKLVPDNAVKYYFHNVNQLIRNNWFNSKKMKLTSSVITIKKSTLVMNNNELQKFSGGKLVTLRNFNKVSKKSST